MYINYYACHSGLLTNIVLDCLLSCICSEAYQTFGFELRRLFSSSLAYDFSFRFLRNAFRFSALSSLIGLGEDESGFIYIVSPVSTSDLDDAVLHLVPTWIF